MDTKIKKEFWRDPAIEEMTGEQKLAVIWLMTAHPNLVGWVECTKRRFELETSTPYQALVDATQALGKGCLVHAKGFWLRNFVRYQIGVGEKLRKNNLSNSIVQQMGNMPDDVVSEFLLEYPELEEKYKAIHKGLASPPQGGREGEGEGEGEKKGSAEGKAKRGKGYSQEFLTFWAAYPRKKSKDQAWTTWQKRKDLPSAAILLAAIEAQKKTEWSGMEVRYIPHPSTWLNAGGWADEVGLPPSQPSGAVTTVSRPAYTPRIDRSALDEMEVIAYLNEEFPTLANRKPPQNTLAAAPEACLEEFLKWKKQ